MKVLVIGSGGREHALAWRLAQCPSVKKVFISPGNPGAAKVAATVAATDIDGWLAFALEKNIDLTIVGPEAPLVAGIVDRFRAAGLVIVGPTSAAAQLEGSKSYAKEIMIRAGVPTARYRIVTSLEDARKALDEFGFPVVLKADGLAAGKGVVIAEDRARAEAALPALLGSRLVIEEFLEGEEVSFIVVSDGVRALPFAPTQDHKAAFDGDLGPNTGGMGAYRDAGILQADQIEYVSRSIIDPVLALMSEDGLPFTGFLYAGLMMTAKGPTVLEFNVRLGDPETQPLMHGLSSDLGEVLLASARGDLSGTPPLAWVGGASACIVLAAHGYPGTVRSGDDIHGIDLAEAQGCNVFHAGTRAGVKGLETSGGRVLGVTASSSHGLREAVEAAYSGVHQIHFEGMHFRADIGAKGMRRF
ncbi:MAG: phosphoribosylamine--glycine ligase [Bryobacteraceae bacterium]|nr:phosphoribosylamine--glycine ligase [Bryobacteraceae bacterium]